METLHNKTTGQGLQRMGAFDVFNAEIRDCERHGQYNSSEFKWGWSPCPKCHEEKVRTEDEERQRRDEAMRQQARMDSLFRRAAIPPRFSDRRLDTYVATLPGQEKALAVAQAYASEFTADSGQSLILCGGVGSGKTHIAVGIAHELIERYYVCVFTSVIGAIRSVKETYSRNSEITEQEAINNLIEPDLLILDEVGVQFGSDAEKLILFEIINGRYENRKSTIVISNLAMTALSEYLGERVVDRLREDGGKMVVFDWPSYRRQAA